MFDGIRLKPEGIKKINKKLVVGCAGALLVITVLLFGLESERARNPAAAQTKKDSPAAMPERVNVESFNALPQNYAFIQGLVSKKDAQGTQQGPQTPESPSRPANQPSTAQQ